MLIGDTFSEVYKQLAYKLFVYGDEATPRGKRTKELLQETFCIEKPWMNLALIPGRNFSLMHAIAESLLLVTPRNEAVCYSFINKNMLEYSDDGKTMYGAYGYRIAGRIQDIVKKLRDDKDTRQAVLTIHRLQDTFTQTKDVPCTIALQFTIREEKLNMHVYMRSNDLIWGTPYDVFVFTNLQMTIANSLGIDCGKYYHTATSLHVYEEMFEVLEKIVSNKIYAIGHMNKNTVQNWSFLADIFAVIANGKLTKWNEALTAVMLDMDGDYAFAILMELCYRKWNDYSEEYFLKGKEELMAQENKWLFNFSRRWLK